MEKVLDSLSGRMLSFDLTLPNHPAPAGGYPVLVFAHGFKGFKDWGFW
jgi:dipeptidyl aminopeptidase/acylaminoacyl peptidase